MKSKKCFLFLAILKVIQDLQRWMATYQSHYDAVITVLLFCAIYNHFSSSQLECMLGKQGKIVWLTTQTININETDFSFCSAYPLCVSSLNWFNLNSLRFNRIQKQISLVVPLIQRMLLPYEHHNEDENEK